MSYGPPPPTPPALHQHLAAKLADACVNPSYMADLWALYFHRFEEVLLVEQTPGATSSNSLTSWIIGRKTSATRSQPRWAGPKRG
jgi:hypothetical protein